MAVQTRVARLAIAGIADYEKDIDSNDAISQEQVEIKLLKRKGRVKYNKHGTSLEWKVMTERGTVDEMSAEARADFVPVNPGVNLSLSNDGYKTADLVHEIDLMEAGGAQQIFNIIENRTKWMPEALGYAWCTDFYGDGSSTTYGTNPITGVLGALISSGTYAGVSFTTETTLAAQVLSGGVHATYSTDPIPSLTASVLACMRGNQIGMGTSRPDVILMDFTNFGYLLNAANDLRSAVRHETDTDLGVEKVMFMGCEVIPSRFCTAARNIVLTTKHIEVHTPYGQFFQFRKKDNELSPVSIPMLNFFYGKLVFKLSRPHARVTTS